jgi:hypothetical protein
MGITYKSKFVDGWYQQGRAAGEAEGKAQGIAQGEAMTRAMITCASIVSACALAALLVPAIRHAGTPAHDPPDTKRVWGPRRAPVALSAMVSADMAPTHRRDRLLAAGELLMARSRRSWKRRCSLAVSPVDTERK